MNQTAIFSALSFEVHSQVDLYLSKLLNYHCNSTSLVVICEYGRSIDGNYIDCERVWNNSDSPIPVSQDLTKSACGSCSKAMEAYWKSYGFTTIKGDELLKASSLDFVPIVSEATWSSRHISIRSACGNIQSSFQVDYSNKILSSVFTRTRTSSVKELYRLSRSKGWDLTQMLDGAVKLFVYGLIVARATYVIYPHISIASCFSGRFNPSAGILAYHNLSGRQIVMHERGYLKGSFLFSLMEEPANPFLNYKQWLSSRSSNLSAETKKILLDYILSKVRGINYNGYRFVSDDQLTDSFHSNNRYLCYFTSSSDELASFVPHYTFERQLYDIRLLLRWGLEHSVQVVVRHHPNLGQIGRPNAATQFLEDVQSLKNPGLTILSPTCNINTYKLAFRALFNICPLSTLSLDLPIIGCRVISISDSPYAELYESTIDINSLENVQLEFLYSLGDSSIYSEQLLYFAYCHYISISWCFSGISIDGFRPGNICLANVSQDHNATLFISNLRHLLTNRAHGFISTC
ncbi:hypothetical protein N8645_00880 [bacterium]|nr:hypothetical protein [bacterium]